MLSEAPEGRPDRSPAPALSEAEWGDRREPWDPRRNSPEPRQGRFFPRWCPCRVGSGHEQRGESPLTGLCVVRCLFPGLPLVALGYGPVARRSAG